MQWLETKWSNFPHYLHIYFSVHLFEITYYSTSLLSVQGEPVKLEFSSKTAISEVPEYYSSSVSYLITYNAPVVIAFSAASEIMFEIGQ